MAFNPYMPMYQQMYQQAIQPQVSSGTFINVPSETVARNYHLAPGTSGTFINENAPYCYTKTMGLNQFDRPIFKRYRLVEEEDAPQSAQSEPTASETADSSIAIPDKITADIASLRALYDDLKLDVEILKESAENVKSADTSKLTAE